MATHVTTPIEYFLWWIVDERSGTRRRTTYRMAREVAAERFSGAEPDLQTREVRLVPEPGEVIDNTRPPTR